LPWGWSKRKSSGATLNSQSAPLADDSGTDVAQSTPESRKAPLASSIRFRIDVVFRGPGVNNEVREVEEGVLQLPTDLQLSRAGPEMGSPVVIPI